MHQFKSRGMNRVTTKVMQKVSVLLQNLGLDSGARQQISQHHSRWSASHNAAVLRKYDPINESPLFSVMAGVETCISDVSAISVDRKANMRSYPYLHFWVESCSIHQE